VKIIEEKLSYFLFKYIYSSRTKTVTI